MYAPTSARRRSRRFAVHRLAQVRACSRLFRPVRALLSQAHMLTPSPAVTRSRMLTVTESQPTGARNSPSHAERARRSCLLVPAQLCNLAVLQVATTTAEVSSTGKTGTRPDPRQKCLRRRKNAGAGAVSPFPLVRGLRAPPSPRSMKLANWTEIHIFTTHAHCTPF